MLFSSSVIDYNSIFVLVHIPKSGGTSVRKNISIFFNEDQILRIGEPPINHYVGNQINSKSNYNASNKITNFIKKYPAGIYISKLHKNLKFFFKKIDPIDKKFEDLSYEEKNNLRFISTYQERYTDPVISGKHFLRLLIIRDPVSRIQSYYFNCLKKKNSKKPYAKIAHKNDINYFIEYLYEFRPYMISNPYTVCLSGTNDYLSAKNIINKKFFLAAPQERINDFLYLINSRIFHKNKQDIKKFNVNTLNSKKIIISDSLVRKIISTNQADINLKKYIESEFNSIFYNYKKKNEK